MLALAIPSGSANAEDWRNKLRTGSQAASSPTAYSAPPPPGGADSAFAYRSSYRAGYNSNANADFEPLGSPFAVLEQDLTAVTRAGEALVGMQLRGSIEDAFAADETEFGTVEARTSLSAPLPEGSRLIAGAGYILEDDRGFRSHDLGADVSLRAPYGDLVHFVTVTANRITHDPLRFPEGEFDLGDNDRTRFGIESGLDIPVMKDVTATLAAGLVDLRYVRDTDLAGIARSSTSGLARFGLAFGGDGALTGSFGAILFHRVYEDARFDNDTVVLAEADVSWRLGKRTALGFQYLGDMEETPFYGARNELTGLAAVTLTQTLTEKLTATFVVYEERNDFLETIREDVTRGAGLELTREIAPGLSLAVSGEYETGATSLADDTADVWKISAGFNFAYSK